MSLSFDDDGSDRGEAIDEDIDQIIAELDKEYTGQLPWQAIRRAQRCRRKIVPHLINFIRKATEAVQNGQCPRGQGHLFALYLLTEFRAKEALPAIIESVSLPDEGPFELYGDAITEDLSRVLAALAPDSPQVLDELIANRSLNEYVRWKAAQTYLYLVRDGSLMRDAAVQRLRQNLQDAINQRDADMATGLVAELVSYAPVEAQEETEQAFRQQLVDRTIVGPNTVKKSIAEGELRFQQELSTCRPTGIDDTVEELKWWASFDRQGEPPEGIDDAPILAADDQPETTESRESSKTVRNDQPRVGRNDPCPCGSGRKYKKCCWRAR